LRKIGVLVVGTGMISVNEHLPALARMPNVEIVGIVSRSRSRAEELARKFNAKKAFTDLDEALKAEGVEVVDITRPTYEHKECVLRAFEYGKHVIVEKPIALKLSDAREMINTAKRKGLKFMVAHVLRFWPEYVKAKELIESGAIGEPRIARAYRQLEYPTWSYKMWHKDILKSGGVAVDLSIHDIDYLRWVMGEVDTVYAQGGVYVFKDATAYDYVHMLLKFKSGAIAYVEGSWIMPKGYPLHMYLEVAGTNGLLTVDNLSTAGLKVFKSGGQVSYSTPVPENGYYLELKHFIDCVINDKEPLVTGEEALKSLEVALASIKSIREGMPVKLPLTEEVL